MADDDHFFIQLGYERDGLVGLLGLRPDASEAEVEEAANAYTLEITNDCKRKGGALQRRLKAGEVTQDAFDVQVEQWRRERDERLAEANTLQERHDRVQGAARKRRNAGLPDDSGVPWVDMGDGLPSSLPAICRLVTQRGCADVVPRQVLEGMRRRWREGPDLPEPRPGLGPAELRRVATDDDVLTLDAIDRAWSRVTLTNRSFWSEEVLRWSQDLLAASPDAPDAEASSSGAVSASERRGAHLGDRWAAAPSGVGRALSFTSDAAFEEQHD